jgi:hypothetical protein
MDIGTDRVMDPMINDVARAMTSAPADEGLARRLAARIAAEDGRRTWSRAWLLVPAATCVLALAVFVARENRQPARAPIVQANPDAVRGPTAGPQTNAASPPVASAAPVTTPRTARPTATAATRSDRTAAARLAIPNLEPPAPIVLEPVRVAALVVVMPIEISTIAIDRIEIPPMP